MRGIVREEYEDENIRSRLMPMGGDEDEADQIESRPEKAGSKPTPDESKEGSGKQPTIGGR